MNPGSAVRSLRRFMVVIAIGLGSVLWSSSGLAQTDLILIEEASTSASYVLTEKDAVNRALENSRRLESLDTSLAIRRNRLESATGVRNPELRLRDISTDYLSRSFDEISIGMRWRLPRLGDLSLKKQTEMVRYREAQVEKDIAILELCRKVRRTYADIVLYQTQAEILRERIDIEQRRIAQIERMVAIGRRSIVYFAKSRMWLEDAKSESVRVNKQLMQAYKKLQRLVNIDAPLELVPGELPEIEDDEDQLLPIANANRSELGLLEERMRLADKEFRMQRYKLIPWFSYVEVNYHVEKRRTDWGELMVGIELPIFNFNRGNIEAARLSLDKKQISWDAVQEDISTDLASTLDIYRDSLLDFKTGAVNAANMIRTVDEIIEENRVHETIPIDEVIELERTVLDIRQKQAIRRHRLAHSLYDLYLSLGVKGYDDMNGAGPDGT